MIGPEQGCHGCLSWCYLQVDVLITSWSFDVFYSLQLWSAAALPVTSKTLSSAQLHHCKYHCSCTKRCNENETLLFFCSYLFRTRAFQSVSFWYILAILGKLLFNLPWMLGFCYLMADIFFVSTAIKCIVGWNAGWLVTPDRRLADCDWTSTASSLPICNIHRLENRFWAGALLFFVAGAIKIKATFPTVRLVTWKEAAGCHNNGGDFS